MYIVYSLSISTTVSFFCLKIKAKKYDIFKTFIDFDQTRTINTSSFIEHRCNNSNSVQFHIAANQ